MATSKGKVIEEIFKTVGGDQTSHFDQLHDKSITYLEKYLKVVKALK